MSEAMRRGAVEARRAHNPEVAGSSPAAATTTGPCVALPHEATGRALVRDRSAPAPNGGPERPHRDAAWLATYNRVIGNGVPHEQAVAFADALQAAWEDAFRG